MWVLRPASGKCQEVLLAYATSQIALTENIQYAKVLYFGVVYPESCHWEGQVETE